MGLRIIRAPQLLVLLLAAAPAAPARAQDRGELAALEAAARTDSLDPQSHYDLGLARLRAGRRDDAEASLRTTVRLDPRMAIAHLALAVVRDRDGNYWNGLRHRGGDSAVARERRARDDIARHAILLDPLVDLMVLGLGDPDRYGLGGMLARDGYEIAWHNTNSLWLIFLAQRRVIDSLPPGLLWAHGILSAHTGRLPMAIADIAALVHVMQAVERDSTRSVPLPTNDVRYLLAALQQRAGNRPQAIVLYREVIENDVGNYMAMVQLARVHEAGQEWSQAVTARRAAIAANPDDATLEIDLAATLLNARFTARAESVLVAAQPGLARDPRYYYLLGRVQMALEKRAEARAALERFLVLAPSRWADAIADARTRLDFLR